MSQSLCLSFTAPPSKTNINQLYYGGVLSGELFGRLHTTIRTHPIRKGKVWEQDIGVLLLMIPFVSLTVFVHMSELECQMEFFPNLLDSFHVSIWEIDHRKHLKREGENKRWLVEPGRTLRIFYLYLNQLATAHYWCKGETWRGSPCHGKPRCSVGLNSWQLLQVRIKQKNVLIILLLVWKYHPVPGLECDSFSAPDFHTPDHFSSQPILL